MNFGYPIQELDDSPHEKITRDGVTVTRKFLIPWSRRLDFATRMTSQNYGYAVGPAAYPFYPYCFVDAIEFTSFNKRPDQFVMTDPASQVNTFTGKSVRETGCLAVVNYSTLKGPTSDPKADELPDGTWATYRQTFSGEFMTIPSRALKFSTSGKQLPPDARACLFIPLSDHIITWNKVKDPPWTHISKLRGQVNSASFRLPGSNGQSREAGTILFEGGEVGTDYKVDPNQPQLWNLSYTFKERRIKSLSAGTTIYGWNHLYDPAEDRWDEVVDATNNQKQYLSGNLKRLFQFEATG